MEMHCLKALYKLAKDIIEGGPGSQIRLDTSLFDGKDSSKISLTLKNYKRPSGVATQIFNVNLIGYSKHIDDEKMLVATHGSTNAKSIAEVTNVDAEGKTEVSPKSAAAQKAAETTPLRLGKELSVIKEMTTDQLGESKNTVLNFRSAENGTRKDEHLLDNKTSPSTIKLGDRKVS